MNGASKTMGLAKFLPKFTGLIVSFFLTVMYISQSRFFSQTCLAESIFFKAKKAMKNRFVSLYIVYKLE